MKWLLLLILFRISHADEVWVAHMVPKDAYPVLVPKNMIRIVNSASSSDGIALEWLKTSGEKVQKGDVIVRYQTRGSRWEEHLERYTRQEVSQRDAELLKLQSELEALKKDREKSMLEVESLALKLDARSVMSVRESITISMDVEILKIEVSLKDVEIGKKQASLTERERYWKERVGLHEGFREHLAAQLGRYEYKAPMDGVVWQAIQPQWRRPARKGDYLNSGDLILEISQSDFQEVRIEVPEEAFLRIRVGTLLPVRLPGSLKTVQVRIESISSLPRTIGDLRENFTRADAMERRFLATADFVGQHEFPPGSELEVLP